MTFLNLQDAAKIVTITKVRSNYLNRQADTTDSDMHKVSAETIAQLAADIGVLRLAMRDAISEIKTQDYDNAMEGLGFALEGFVPDFVRGPRLYCSDDGNVDTTVTMREDGCEEHWCAVCHKKLMVVEL